MICLINESGEGKNYIIVPLKLLKTAQQKSGSCKENCENSSVGDKCGKIDFFSS